MSNIALVSEHASPLAALGGRDAGGQNVYVACLAAELVALGHSVVVYTRRDDPRLPAETRTSLGVVVRHLDAGPAAPIDKDDLLEHMPAMARELARWFEVDVPDVVHSHFWMSGLISVEAAGRVPVVHTYHALGAVKQRYQGAADHSPSERAAVEAMLLCRAHRIVATCSDEVRELLQMGASPERISVVPCGYDNTVFCPRGPASVRTARHRIVCVSRLVARKGLDDVVRALRFLPDTELVIAGGPPTPRHLDEPHARELVELAASIGVDDRVVLVGGLDPPAVAALDRSADVFVSVPWYEPFGIAPVEAMACGVPVVVSSVGGMLDTVVDGGTGVLVPPHDPAELAIAIRGFLDNPLRRVEFGARGAVRAARRFAWPVVARAMDRIYSDVIATGLSVPSHRVGPS